MQAQIVASIANNKLARIAKVERSFTTAVSQKAAPRRHSLKVSAEAPVAEASGIEKSGPNMKAVKEIQEIMDILPHRSDHKSTMRFSLSSLPLLIPASAVATC
jgi:hypothetical protein